MTNEIADLLNDLHNGSVTIDQVADKFRTRKWPRRRPVKYETQLDRAAAEQNDPEPYLPGSFDDVIAAYDQKKLTREQLAILSEAVAVAQRTEDAGES